MKKPQIEKEKLLEEVEGKLIELGKDLSRKAVETGDNLEKYEFSVKIGLIPEVIFHLRSLLKDDKI